MREPFPHAVPPARLRQRGGPGVVRPHHRRPARGRWRRYVGRPIPSRWDRTAGW